MRVYNLQINHLHRPVGIDGRNLRLTWCLEEGVLQSAYQVQCVLEDGNAREDTGVIQSQEMFYELKEAIPYRSRALVTVRVWDENGREGESASLAVVTGIGREDWKAGWINPEMTSEPRERKPGSYLKKNFELKQLPENARAMLYITAHGIFNVYLNRREVSDHQLMPGSNQVNKRLMVETLEVTPFLRQGSNELVVTLGDGWYRGSMGFDQNKNVFGTDVALLCQLELDGEVIAVSDESWLASQDGPLGKNDFMAGEEYDARREETMTWHGVKAENFGYANLICADTVPVLPHERFPAKLLVTPKGEKVLDFGQNIAGYVFFDLQAKSGAKLRLVHGETLDAEGNFTIENFQNPKARTEQEILYTCREGRNIYHPTKTYMGFRYALVEADFAIRPEDFTAVAIYSDMRQTAEFSCGVPEVDQLFSNAVWSMKGNFVEVPTDCPTREKSGFSGDAQVFVTTGMYLMDAYPVYAKWLREQAATQFKDGCVAQIAPSPSRKKTMMDGGIGWSDSILIVPWKLYQRYGDASLLAELLPVMENFMRFRLSHPKKVRFKNRKRIPRKYRPYVMDHGWLWGEWLEPDTDLNRYIQDIVFRGDPELSTAYLSYDCEMMASVQALSGNAERAAFYRDYSEKCREAYHFLFLKDGRIEEPKRQCRYVRPVAMHMLTPEEEKAAAAALAGKVAENGHKLNTGFLSTHELCRVLSDHGQADTAYGLLLQREAPGWLYSVLCGATTVPEDWNAYGKDGERKASFNHYSYGAIAGWLIDGACGIRVEEGRITVSPHPDERLGFARASYDSPVGKIVSAWRYEQGEVSYEIEIPANATARIILPDGRESEVGAGKHIFSAFGKMRV